MKCFSVLFLFQREKNYVTAWNISSSFLDFFDMESRGAIVDEAPKAEIDSYVAFDYLFFCENSLKSIREKP